MATEQNKSIKCVVPDPQPKYLTCTRKGDIFKTEAKSRQVAREIIKPGNVIAYWPNTVHCSVSSSVDIMATFSIQPGGEVYNIYKKICPQYSQRGKAGQVKKLQVYM